AHLDRTDVPAHAMGDGRVDGVFGDVSLHPEIVVAALVLGQGPALLLHLVRRLPCADQNLPYPAHGLAVGGDDGEGPYIMQDVLRGDDLLADAALGEGDVLGDRAV